MNFIDDMTWLLVTNFLFQNYQHMKTDLHLLDDWYCSCCYIRMNYIFKISFISINCSNHLAVKLGINWTIVRRTNHASRLILPFFVCMTQTMSLANGLCKPDTAYNKLNNTEITYTLVFRFHNAVKIDRKKNHMKQNYYLPASLLG